MLNSGVVLIFAGIAKRLLGIGFHDGKKRSLLNQGGLLKFNMEPENQPLEKEILLETIIVRFYVKLPEGK